MEKRLCHVINQKKAEVAILIAAEAPGLMSLDMP